MNAMTPKIPGAILVILLSLCCVWPIDSFYTKFDSYGNLCLEDERARLDNFAIHLQKSPNTIGYITVFAGQQSCKDEAKYRANRARDWVVKRGVASNRVVVKDGGYRADVQTILFLLNKDLPPPELEPDLQKDKVSVHKCADKVFARAICPK